MPTDRAPTTAETEQWALDLLLKHVTAAGQDVKLLGRPAPIEGRSPDFEVEVDGQLVAVEVTQLWLSAHQMTIASRIEREVRRLVGTEPPPGDGLILVHIFVRDGARSRSAPRVAAAVAERLTSVADIETSFELEQVRVRISRHPGAPSTIGFASGAQRAGGYTAAMAAEFVDTLLDSKTTQAATYKEAWILVIENMLIVDAEEIAGALRARSADIPENWTRMFILPANNRVPVEVMFRGTVSAARVPDL